MTVIYFCESYYHSLALSPTHCSLISVKSVQIMSIKSLYSIPVTVLKTLTLYSTVVTIHTISLDRKKALHSAYRVSYDNKMHVSHNSLKKQ
jgi:hypothetical protein